MTLDIFAINSPEWMLSDKRNCNVPVQYDTPKSAGAFADQWHPSPINERSATKLCRGCPAQTACLTYAMEDPELTGVWGGTTTAERNELRAGRDPLPMIGAGKKCGSVAGYEAHRRAQTRFCQACRDAWNTYKRGLRAQGAARAS